VTEKLNGRAFTRFDPDDQERSSRIYKLVQTYGTLYIERALGLPLGEIRKGWGDPIMGALLDMVASYPWMMKVADSGYDPDVAYAYEHALTDPTIALSFPEAAEERKKENQ
jgi:hypothetical protein